MKTAILIQAHKNLDYFTNMAKINPNVNFYVHFDKKFIAPSIKLTNFFFIPDPIDVKWGGMSQVNATLKLFRFALQNVENEFFHLISAEDVILKDIAFIEEDWNQIGRNKIFIESKVNKNLGYRTRFNAWHADTKYQRKFIGKLYTKFLQLISKVISSKDDILTGSNWISIRRNQLVKLMLNISQDDLNYFKKKLNPDEHFFQYILHKYNFSSNVAYINKRYIIFNKGHNRGNNPLYLNFNQLLAIDIGQYWFARKVDVATQIKFFKYFYSNEDIHKSE